MADGVQFKQVIDTVLSYAGTKKQPFPNGVDKKSVEEEISRLYQNLTKHGETARAELMVQQARAFGLHIKI